MKILWLTNIPSPYRIDFFNELGKKSDLTVLFEREYSLERDKSWKSYNFDYFKGIFMRGWHYGVAEAFCPEIAGYLNKNMYDHIIVTNFSSPSGWFAIMVMRLKGIPYMLESDGAFTKKERLCKQLFKKMIISGAQRYFSTSIKHEHYYYNYGAPVHKIIRYPFTSIKESDIIPQLYNNNQKKDIRNKLSLKEDKIVLSVGQFIPRKGFDILLEACVGLDKSIGVYIIGGQPNSDYLDFVSKHKLSNVHFVGYKQQSELSEYYLASDVFVLPTREDIWGLVVNEAMAKGLPVITTESCLAGSVLIENGSNGFIVPVNDVQSLKNSILRVLDCSNDSMGLKSLSIIKSYTIEKMTQFHLEVFEGKI